MPKFFINLIIPDDEGKLLIQGDDRKHMRDVLRMKKGEAVTVCDNIGVDHLCEIESYEDEGVVLRILSRCRPENESRLEIVIYQGLPKADKMELIIQKCVELGCAAIVPVSCRRSVVKISDMKDAGKKVQRWNRIAYEAAKQCSRNRIPVVMDPVTIQEAVDRTVKSEIGFVPWECENGQTIKGFLNQKKCMMASPGKDKITLSFIVGPEGGFSVDEIDLIKKNGIPTVSLGKRILRTETAAPAILAMLLYEFEL